MEHTASSLPTASTRSAAHAIAVPSASDAVLDDGDLRQDGRGGDGKIQRHHLEDASHVDHLVLEGLALSSRVDEHPAGQIRGHAVREELVEIGIPVALGLDALVLYVADEAAATVLPQR
jgi:hypothetical protein